MSAEENKAVTRRFLEEIFSAGNLELVDELFAPNYVLHDPAIPHELCGPEGIKQYVAMYRAAYPDMHFTIQDQIGEGDEVVTRWTGQGTHEVELMSIAPTGSVVTVTGIELDRIADGKIEES